MSKELGKKIKELREKSDFRSLRAFALKLGKSPTFVWKVEQGESVPSAETIQKMAELLNADGDELLRLANKIAPDVQETLVKESEMVYFFRTIRDLPPKEREKLRKQLEKKKK